MVYKLPARLRAKLESVEPVSTYIDEQSGAQVTVYAPRYAHGLGGAYTRSGTGLATAAGRIMPKNI